MTLTFPVPEGDYKVRNILKVELIIEHHCVNFIMYDMDGFERKAWVATDKAHCVKIEGE